MGEDDFARGWVMINLSTNNTYYKNLIGFYKTYKDHLKFSNTPTDDLIEIVDDQEGLPCISIFSSLLKFQQIKSDLILVDASSEGANIIHKFNKFPKDKKYVLLTNGWIDHNQYSNGWGTSNHLVIDHDYTHIVWNYFLQEMAFKIAMPNNIEYWQKQSYDYFSEKSNLFCCLVGWKRPNRDTFAQSLLSNCQGIQYVFNYNGEQLAKESRKYDVNWNFDNYHSYKSALDYTHYSISNTIPINLYNTCRFYLTVETVIDMIGEFHLTEKTIKPIIAGMPFVLVASPRYLENLKKLGFKTFESLWDESYDKIMSFEQRLQAVMDLIKFLNDGFDWSANISKLQEITNHNRMNFLYNTSIHKEQIVNFAKVIKESCA